ncbi:hypothetical protein [Umezawaea tangerina]|uniref:Transmembrane protein n=1 Tax=Umezawaea tangerina TaxID=84725 RepID=A0A2T0T993_9PSEU|nr:hypothetical protein [Umezawaea tangerina]PRY42211.1 hypothetical protein CLV43_10441 [Umezawaea tangerina]
MKWYADGATRFVRQVVADLLAVGWVWFWVWFALNARDGVLSARAPGDGLVDAGGRVHDAFADAAGSAGRVPIVGGDLAGALGKGTDAGTTLANVGHAQIEAVETVALWVTVGLIAVPVMFLLITWLPLRVRFARRAYAARQLSASGRTDLLALHALNTMSLGQLARFDDDPVDGWRRGDPEVIAVLASRRLGRLGVRG